MTDNIAIDNLRNAVIFGFDKLAKEVARPKKTIVVTIDYDEYENEKQISFKQGKSKGFLNCCLQIAEWKNSGLPLMDYINKTGRHDLIEVFHAIDNPSRYIKDFNID